MESQFENLALFGDEELDLKNVLDGAPWTFNNHLLILHHLQQGDHPLQVSLLKVPFLVQIHDLPLGYLTEAIEKQLGNFVGSFVEYDQTNKDALWMTYLQVCVEINVSLPLK
ncbi:hypothetical protein ACS0TY_010015 [Phlomoides rotata]